MWESKKRRRVGGRLCHCTSQAPPTFSGCTEKTPWLRLPGGSRHRWADSLWSTHCRSGVGWNRPGAGRAPSVGRALRASPAATHLGWRGWAGDARWGRWDSKAGKKTKQKQRCRTRKQHHDQHQRYYHHHYGPESGRKKSKQPAVGRFGEARTSRVSRSAAPTCLLLRPCVGCRCAVVATCATACERNQKKQDAALAAQRRPGRQPWRSPSWSTRQDNRPSQR